MDFLAIARGNGEVSEQEGLEAFELLAPIVMAAPDDQEAIAAASSTIARMPRDSVGAAVLDWWFVVTTGETSPLGLAFHLPESIAAPVRAAMESVSSLAHSGLRTTPGAWVRSAHELQRLLADLDSVLDLESYGAVKLPQKEREVWSHLQEELAPTTDALRQSRRAEPLEFDERNYEKQMKSAGIDEGSRRWNEMLKRARQCVEQVNRLVEVQQLVEPWQQGDLPVSLDVLPPEIASLGPVAPVVLGAILTREDDDAVASAASVGQLLDRTCAGRSEEELSWLATVADGWIEAQNQPVDGLTQTLARRQRIAERIAELREAGFDADEAELIFLDHDLSGAERTLDALSAQRKAERRSLAISAALEHLRASAEGGATPEGWIDQLQAASRALDAGQVEEAEQLRQALDRDLRASRRSDSIDELTELRRDLELVRAPGSLLAELDEHLGLLEQHPEKSPDSSLLQRSQERLASIRQQRSHDANRGLQTVHELLEEGRDLIPPDSLPSLELRLSQAEELLTAGDTMQALDLVDALQDDINAERVHRWTASEGESNLVQHVVNYCTQQVHFDPDDVRRLYVAAKTKPFVILAGLTGSGKSTIARLFAAALGADDRNGRFQRVAVRPDWIDQSEVLGAVNPLSNRFEPGWLASTARQCERNPDQLHVVLLDEMNLAPVEQYLAEYLSALEEARSGSERTRLPLYSPGMSPENEGDWPSSLAFPLNLIVIGTVNVDETTRVLSDRVLDRANVLQLSVSVSDAHHRPSTRSVQPWHVPFPEWDSICELQPDDGHHDFLVEVSELLQGIGIGVGQRAHVELERFVTNAHQILPAERSLDLGVLQRIIPKIRGFKRDLADGLSELHELLGSAACERSAAVVSLWLDDRVSDDEYLDGTDARIGLVR